MWKLENLNSQPMQSQRFTGSEAGRYAALSEEFWVAKKWVVMGLILHCFTKLQYFWDMFFQVYPPRLWYWGSDLDLGVIYFPNNLGFKEPQNLPFSQVYPQLRWNSLRRTVPCRQHLVVCPSSPSSASRTPFQPKIWRKKQKNIMMHVCFEKRILPIFQWKMDVMDCCFSG